MASKKIQSSSSAFCVYIVLVISSNETLSSLPASLLCSLKTLEERHILILIEFKYYVNFHIVTLNVYGE